MGNIIWNKTIGWRNSETVYVEETSDGGYILVGTDYTHNWDIRLIKTDEDGNLVWDKVLSTSYYETGECVHQTSDGGYILCGGSDFVILIKTDDMGNVVWDKRFDTGDSGGARSLQQTSDGGYILVGDGYSSLSGKKSLDVLLIKTDGDGNLLWKKYFGGKGCDEGHWVEETRDGGFIIVGEFDRFGCDDIWLIKTDSYGNMEWDKFFGSGLDHGYCIRQTSDGGFIVTGYTYSYGMGSQDVWLIKLDSNGDMVWNRTYGGGSFDWGTYVEETSDGGFIILGNTDFYSHGYSDFWLIKTDGYGNREWSRILGGDGPEVASYLCKSSDGGYVMVGYTKSFGAGDEDFWLVKVMPDDLPPSKPVVSGSTTGRINKPYTINFSAVDPEGDDIYYFVVVWYYGVSGWLGPYKSGETASFTFPPTKEGSFNITVKAMDDRGCDGPVSDPIRVTFPKPYWFNLLPPFIHRMLFGFKLGCL